MLQQNQNDLRELLLTYLALPEFEVVNQIYIGFSGGIDSTALLHLFSQCCPKTLKLAAVHINHKLQDQASEWELHCAQQCHLWKVPYFSIEVDLSKETSNIEEKARKKRYQSFEKLLDQHSCLFLAHHLEDQIETFMINLLRGTGVRGIGMPQSRVLGQGFLFRPFLFTSKQALITYVDHHELRYVEDFSNQDDRFDRNFLRHQVLTPFFQRFAYRLPSIARSCSNILEDKQLLIQEIKKYLEIALTEDHYISLAKFQLFSTEIQKQLLKEWSYLKCGIYLSSKDINQLLDKIYTSASSVWLGIKDYFFVSDQQYLYIFPKVRELFRNFHEVSWYLKDALNITLGKGRLIAIKAVGEHYNLLPLEIDNLRLVSREKVLSNKLMDKKKLSDLFRNQRIPDKIRGNWPIMLANNQLYIPHKDKSFLIGSENNTRKEQGWYIIWEVDFSKISANNG